MIRGMGFGVCSYTGIFYPTQHVSLRSTRTTSTSTRLVVKNQTWPIPELRLYRYPWMIASLQLRVLQTLFITRHDAYACTARYCYSKSVRPSVRHTLVLHRNKCTYHRQTLSTCLVRAWLFSFLKPTVTKFHGDKYTEAEWLIQQRRLKLAGHIARAEASEDHSRALRASTDRLPVD